MPEAGELKEFLRIAVESAQRAGRLIRDNRELLRLAILR